MAIPAVAGETHDAGLPPQTSKDTAIPTETITIAPTVAALLEKRIEGRPADDFVFTSRTGLPLHNGDFYTHVWRKLMTAVEISAEPGNADV